MKKDSSVPIYTQVESIIRDLIDTEELAVGDRAPSEREIASDLGISRMTARAALSKLVTDGYLRTVQGKGHFVANPKLRQDLRDLTSFTEDMLRRGLTPGSRLLNFETSARAPQKVRQLMGLSAAEGLLRIDRLRTADGEPMSLETSYLPEAAVPWLREGDVRSGSLYGVLGSRGIELAKAEEHLEATLVTEEEGKLLTTEAGSPALLIERTSYTDDDRAIEHVKSVYRGDRYRFSAMLFRRRTTRGRMA